MRTDDRRAALLRWLPEPVEDLKLQELMRWSDAHPAGALRDAAEEVTFVVWRQHCAGHSAVPENTVRAGRSVQLEPLEEADA